MPRAGRPRPCRHGNRLEPPGSRDRDRPAPPDDQERTHYVYADAGSRGTTDTRGKAARGPAVPPRAAGSRPQPCAAHAGRGSAADKPGPSDPAGTQRRNLTGHIRACQRRQNLRQEHVSVACHTGRGSSHSRGRSWSQCFVLSRTPFRRRGSPLRTWRSPGRCRGRCNRWPTTGRRWQRCRRSWRSRDPWRNRGRRAD